jgi:hypothetical protein
MSLPSLQTLLVFEHRERKRTKIEQFFTENLGQWFSTRFLHEHFGSSVRTRISEINRTPDAAITIRNEYCYEPEEAREVSTYWAETRGVER